MQTPPTGPSGEPLPTLADNAPLPTGTGNEPSPTSNGSSAATDHARLTAVNGRTGARATEPRASAELQPQRQPQSKTESQPQNQPKAESQPEPDKLTQAQPGPSRQPEPKLAEQTAPQPNARPESNAGTQTAPHLNLRPESEPKVQAALEAESQPESKQPPQGEIETRAAQPHDVPSAPQQRPPQQSPLLSPQITPAAHAAREIARPDAGPIASNIEGHAEHEAAHLSSPQAPSQLQIIAQIAHSARAQLRDGRSELTLRLDPPSLGTVHMRVVAQGSAMTAHLEASLEASRDLINANLPVLKDALAGMGIDISHFSVTVGGGERDGAAHGQAAQQHAAWDGASERALSSPPPEDATLAALRVWVGIGGRHLDAFA